MLEIRLQESYSRIIAEIPELSNSPESKNTNRQRQQKQAIQNKSNSKQEGDEKILLFTDSKKKVVRNWQKKIAGQVVKLSQHVMKHDKKEDQGLDAGFEKMAEEPCMV